MDQEFYWNDIFPHSSGTDANMSYAPSASGVSSILNTRTSNGLSSSEHSQIGDRRIGADDILSLEDVEIDLNTNDINNGQPFSFSLSSITNDEPQDRGRNVARGSIGGASESRLFSRPYISSLVEQERRLSSSYSPGTSSGTNGFTLGDYDDGLGSSSDGRRLAGKRKNIASGSANLLHSSESSSFVPVTNNASAGINISSPSSYISGASSTGEQLNASFSTITRGAVPNAESSQRNFRPRTNPVRQHDANPLNLYPSTDTVGNSSIWLTSEPSFHFTPLNQSLDSRSAAASSSSLQLQPQIPVIPSLSQNANLYPWTGAPIWRNGNSSSSSNLSETLRSIQEETLTRNNTRNNLSDQSSLVPATELRNFANDSAALRAVNSSGVLSSAGPTWVPNRNPSTQVSQNFTQSLSEAVQETLLTSSASDSGGHSATSLEAGHQSGSYSRGPQQSHMTSLLLNDRQFNGVPFPSRSVAGREGRRRMILEIRNALDLMRRGENLRFEDVFMFDHPLVHGAADLHDRHRDMRLDVDNMSYEELLALEERIGSVNTGLGEETILKSLKQRKHSLVRVGATEDTEPCCICQEEYAEDEDLGALDCGHDFHTACIKQWLLQKNMCPICKTTAVVT